MVLKSIDSDPDCLGSNPHPAIYIRQVILPHCVNFLIHKMRVIIKVYILIRFM